MTSHQRAATSSRNSSSNGNSNSNNTNGTGHDAAGDSNSHLSEELTSIRSEGSRSPRSDDTSARRRRILLGVLFRLLVNGRDPSDDMDEQDDDHDDDDDDDEEREPEPPVRPLRILSCTEAESLGATCRICFDGPSMDPSDVDNNSSNPLISPCNCSGGSAWIHRQCLRQWQRHAVNNHYCNVCRSRYSLRPPRARSSFSAGNLLVYMDESISGTFAKTIVLILKHDANSTFGLIINAPSQSQHVVRQLALPSCFQSVSWRRGGPVCGGRLGLVRYIVAHTLPLTNAQAEQGDEEGSGTLVGDDFVSRSAFSTEPTLQFLYDCDDPSSPATFPESELPTVLQALANKHREQQQSSNSSSSTTTTTGQLFLFGGYSQWGRGQLAREIQRGSWGVCENGTLEDVLRPLDASYYDELISNNPNGRMLLGPQLFQEE